jgi:serine protease
MQDPYDPLWSLDNGGDKWPDVNKTGGKMGTSFSAPLAAGVASLMLTVNPGLSPAALIQRMQAGAKPFPEVPGFGYCNPNLLSNGLCNCTKTTCGAGLLDADEALRLAYGPAVIIEPIGTVLPSATITLDGSQSKSISGRDIDTDTYQWTLLSGPATITIPDADKAITSLRLPDTPGSWVFKLTVEDDAGDSGSGTITVVAASPPPTGGGGGALGWAWGAGLWAWVLALGWRQRRR